MSVREQLYLSFRALCRESILHYKSSLLTYPVRPQACQATRSFSSTRIDNAKSRPRPRGDPYTIMQARQRRAANISRQAELSQARLEALGDPVRGQTTPFVEAFDTAATSPDAPSLLNYSLNESELETSLASSKALATPVPMHNQPDEIDYTRLEQRHTKAAEALKRITAISNGSKKDIHRANISKCISTFGRHNTDPTLPARPKPATAVLPQNAQDKIARAGLDTGSSEVQIAILTARIRSLADAVEKSGSKDKSNKRNLRLLVHRRQKLLAYLRRKERGGPRWLHCIETLGLTEGTWRGEISM